MEDPFDPLRRRLNDGEIGEVDRVDECRASAFAAKLYEIGALAIPESRCALGIERERTDPGSELRCIAFEVLEGGDHLGDAVAWF